MSNILHIKDAYFELPEKCKDDIGCMVTLLGIPLQHNKDVADSEQCKIEYEIIENVEEGDTIRMEVDSILTDKQGNSIMVKSVQPEYMLDSIL